MFTTTKNQTPDVAAEITRLRDALDRLASQVPAEPARTGAAVPTLAKGTDDLTAAAARATLPDRVEAALQFRPHAIDSLCREVRAPAGPVSAILKRLRAAKKIANVGTGEHPAWFWIVTDDATPDQLHDAVTALIRFRPMTFAELTEYTGARRGRVSGQLVQFERAEVEGFVKVGDPMRWHYSLAPAKR